ncbi:MFS transporter [Acidipropionibacterium acidipropionici]|uniref:MFS transporter n=1 Tax=Acidipropionibacterium acidipropionici TaxID=1748 RepID=UPI0002EF39F9|nr:MFS transporter [Acidipropionibacterium acidipropionici]
MQTNRVDLSGTDSPRGSHGPWGPVMAALVFLVALNLRPALTAVGPVLPRLGADLRIDEGAQGLIGSLPLLAFAAVSPVVHRVAARLGTDRTVLVAVVLLASGILIRSTTGVPGLWVGTVVVGSAIAVGNVLVPVIVRRDYPGRVSAATGVYSACITLAAALASVAAVPLADASGWRAALGVWALPAGLVALVWGGRCLRAPVESRPAAVASGTGAEGSLWRRRQT